MGQSLSSPMKRRSDSTTGALRATATSERKSTSRASPVRMSPLYLLVVRVGIMRSPPCRSPL